MATLGSDSPYTRASRQGEEDSISMLPHVEPTGFDSEKKISLDDEIYQCPPTWHVSPTQPQTSVSPGDRRISRPVMGFSVFGSDAASETVYQEQVAWANSTHFRSQPSTSAKPQMAPTVSLSTTDEESSPNHRYLRKPRHMLEPWMTGVWIRFPWWGFGALILVLLLTVASAAMLLASDGTSPEQWSIGHDNAQPHVYVSVFEMAMNFLILFALTEGVVIRLWRQLLRGAELDSIHDTYDSIHLWSAIKRVARLRFNLVATACILASISFARGPLFQRALTLTEDERGNLGGVLDLKIAPYPLKSFFENNQPDPPRKGDVTSIFSDVIIGNIAGDPLPYEQPSFCGEYCTGNVKAYTFQTECESTVQNINIHTIMRECDTCTTDQCTSDCRLRQQAGLSATFFSVGYEQEKNHLVLTSYHKDKISCSGEVNFQKCTLTESMADVPFIITNGTIDMRSDAPLDQFYNGEIPINGSFISSYWPLAFSALFPSVSINVTAPKNSKKLEYTRCLPVGVSNSANPSTSATCSNSTLPPALKFNDPSIIFADKYEPNEEEDPLCGLTWKDPMPSMVSKMQSLAFRTTIAMATAPDSLFAPALTERDLSDLRSTWTQRVSTTGSRTMHLYRASPPLVALGIAVSLIGVIAVVPLYWGFWEMGRKVSLNPLELARAFGAPLMDGLDGNTTPDMISVERGGVHVKYGAVDRYGEEKQLRVEQTERCNIRTPWQGEIFG